MLPLEWCISLLQCCFFQVSYLGVVGGENEQDTVERALSASVSNELARLFNWNGMNDKRAFKKLELAKVVFGMVHHMHHCRHYLGRVAPTSFNFEPRSN